MRRARRGWDDRVVLVTGVGGFVGGSVATELLARGAHVVGIVRDGRSLRQLELLGIRRRVDVVTGDITDPGLVLRTVGDYEVDTIFHFAAQTSPQVARRSPVSTLSSNVAGTWNILEAARLNPLVRSVVVASILDDAAGTERHAVGMPPYEASKVCSDTLSRSYAATFPLPVVSVRCAAVYGPGDTNWARLVPGVTRQALGGEDPLVADDAVAQRDYLFISDAVDGYLSAGDRLPEISGKAVDLTSGRRTSTLALVQMILAEVGDPALQPRLQLDAGRRGEGVAAIGRMIGDIDAAADVPTVRSAASSRRLAGWRPLVPLREGVAATVQWYRDYLATGKLLTLEGGLRNSLL